MSSDSSDDDEGLTKAQIKQRDSIWNSMAKFFPMELRPENLRKKKGLGTSTLADMLALKRELDTEETKKNLGEEVFSKDGKPDKVRYKAQSDNSSSKLHPARFNRQPLVHPKEFYHQVPKRREVVVRNFPMEHLGLTGKVSEAVIGKMHNRSVKLTLEQFTKTTQREAKGPHRAGKYADGHQIKAAIIQYGMTLFSLWPNDWTGWVIMAVLNEAHWAEEATNDDKKRAELITEFFNAVLEDNCGKAVNQSYPCVYEQVIPLISTVLRPRIIYSPG